jgi:prepilin-type N-terminal cleavage/methylation domain-containing protein
MYLQYNNNVNKSSGFSLIEIICVLILLGVIASFAFGGFVNSIAGFNFIKQNANGIEKTELAMMRMVLEFGDILNTSMPSVAGSSISYTSSDGGVHVIKLTGSNLMYDTHILCDNITSFVPSYVDSTKIVTVSLTSTMANNVSKTFTTKVLRP